MIIVINTILSDFDFHEFRSRFVAVQKLSNDKGREEELKVCPEIFPLNKVQVFPRGPRNLCTYALAGVEREDEGV